MELHLECDRTPRSNSKIHTYINLDQRIPSAIYIFKVSKKHTRRMCQIYSKLVIKTPEQHLVLLLLTLNIFYILFYCQYCWIRTDKCWLGLRNSSFRQKKLFSVIARNILYGLGKFLVYMLSKLFSQYKVAKGYIFMTAL